MTELKLILFDFDGTVIDGSEGIYNCINYSTDKLGLSRVPQDILPRFVGPSLFDSYKKYCTSSDETANKLIEAYRERYAPEGYAECRLYPRIKELLTSLKDCGYTVAVASSKPGEFVTKISSLLGIYDCFEFFCCPGFSTHSSDKAGLILGSMEKTGCTKAETVMIGDTHFDIEAAKQAGVMSIGVSFGFSQEGELEKAGADFIADSAESVFRYITGHSL